MVGMFFGLIVFVFMRKKYFGKVGFNVLNLIFKLLVIGMGIGVVIAVVVIFVFI